MIAYRLTRRKFSALDGEGGLYASGRCHRKGTRIIYAATSQSLALLEVLVHVAPEDLPMDYVMLEIHIADSVPVQVSDAKAVLAISEHPEYPIYRIPSIIVPAEHNIVLFPQAAGFSVDHVNSTDFEFDPRLFQLRR